MPFSRVVNGLAHRAAGVVAIGQCSAYGGIPAAGSNPAGIQSVTAVTGVNTINVAGCPPHPDWVVSVLVRLVLRIPITLDAYGRPADIYLSKVHQQCPRKNFTHATAFGQDGYCLEDLGCRGKLMESKAVCPYTGFNNHTSWCVEANAPCNGCTNPDFPGTNAFFNKV